MVDGGWWIVGLLWWSLNIDRNIKSDIFDGLDV
jgi:hypothetical protein